MNHASHRIPASLHAIHLYGALREQFEPVYNLHVASVHEATRALNTMIKGFGATVAKGAYRIVVGDKLTGRVLSPDEVGLNLPVSADIHIVPVIGGAGGKGMGFGKIIIGAILVAASWYAGGSAGWSYYAAQAGYAIGASMVLSGAAMVLSPQAKAVQAQQQAADTNSFSFSGVQNTQSQGGAVPVIYGQFEVGSTVISAGISTQQLMN